MLRNYIKLALRNLRKNPMFSTLNLAGLAFGLAVAMLLMLYVRDERSFDAYHSKAERIYRVNTTFTFDGESRKLGNAPNAVGPAMKEAVPEVEEQVRLLFHNFGESAFVMAGSNTFVETKFFWADPSIFQIFDLRLLEGDAATALDAPNKVILSRSAARRYYGSSNPVGQTLKVDNRYSLQVTGVYEDFPGNSSLEAECIGSFASETWAQNPVWSNASFETWLLLRPNTDAARVQQQMATVLEKNVPEENRGFTLSLQRLRDVHLYSGDIDGRSNYSNRIGDPRQVQLVGWLALVILLIACINYMNLATARTQNRFREVGISKTVGAGRGQLLARFYVETGALVLFAMLLSGTLVALALPWFNALTEKKLAFADLLGSEISLGLLAIGAAVTLLAGSYPALYLSGFSPRNLLQTTFRKDSSAGWIRRSLVTVQFVASVALVICALVFQRQLNFIQTKDLGYEPEQVVAVTTVAAQNKEQLAGLMQHYRQLADVKEVCRAQTFPGNGGSGRSMAKPGQPSAEADVTTNRVGSEITKVLNMRLLAGTSLPTPEKAEDDTTVQVVLNETAVKFLGYTSQEALGKPVPNLFYQARSEIVGVVEDFNFESFHKPVSAYAFHNARTETRRFLLVKLNTENLPAAMRMLEKVFREHLPESAFEYQFLDQHLDTLYRADQRTARVVFIFALLAIFIACLGLFGLAAFAAEQRTKEIGIRKVLGASVASVVGLLSRDFMKLVFVAILAATPLAWWAMDQWLQDFAYRIDLQWWMFVLAGGLGAMVAFLTISFQSVRAAVANPVDALRNE